MKALSRIQFTFLFFFSLATIALLSRCGGVSSVYYDGRGCADGISSGAEIYNTVGCSASSCHGSLSAPVNMNNRDLSAFNNAISNIPGMRFLTCLRQAQKEALVNALPPP